MNSLVRSFGTTVSTVVVGVVLAHHVVPSGDTVVTSEAGSRTGLLIGCGVAVAAPPTPTPAEADADADGASAASSAPPGSRRTACAVVRSGVN